MRAGLEVLAVWALLLSEPAKGCHIRRHCRRKFVCVRRHV